MTVGGAGAEKPAGMEGRERGTAKPGEFQWKEMPWNWVLNFFVMPTSKDIFLQKQEHVLIPMEELAGITALIPWEQNLCASHLVGASLATKLRLLHIIFSSDFSGKLLEPADIIGDGTGNSTAQKSHRSRQSPLVPCPDCSAPTQRLRKGKENKRANEDLDIVTVDVVCPFLCCFSNFVFLPILVLFCTFDFDY